MEHRVSVSPERRCQCTCDAWGHPGVCDGRDVCTITATRPTPALDLWPAANVGEFKLCPPCMHALRCLADKISMWDMNMEAFGHPTIEMWMQAEVERLRAG
jgi:hypothetical protein